MKVVWMRRDDGILIAGDHHKALKGTAIAFFFCGVSFGAGLITLYYHLIERLG